MTRQDAENPLTSTIVEFLVNCPDKCDDMVRMKEYVYRYCGQKVEDPLIGELVLESLSYINWHLVYKEVQRELGCRFEARLR